jgi:hypothetical protein
MRFIAAIVIAGFTTPSFAADREPASLVPASVLAYAELRDPAAVAEAWAGWMKGTAFDGTLKTASDRRDRATEFKHLAAISSLGQIGLLASPEAQAEIRKLKGAATALTGFDEQGNAEFVAFVLTGESPVAGLLVRSFLTSSPDIRRVATVQGVPLFQHRVPPAPQFDANGRPLPNPPDVAKPDDARTTYASVPGLFVVASRPKVVEETLKRWAGEGKDSLAESREFRETMNRSQGAVVAFANPQKLISGYAEAVRNPGADPDSAWLAWLRFAVKPEAISTLTASLSVDPDGWDLTTTFQLNPSVASPLFGLIADHTVATAAPSGMGVTVTLPERKPDAIPTFADAVAKAAGVAGRLPSDIVVRAERETGAKWTKTLLPTLKSVTLDWGSRDEAQSKPGIVLSIDSGGNDWDAAIPGLLRAADSTNQPVTPSEERVGSITVKSYSVRFGPWPALHTARSDNRLGISTSRSDAVRILTRQPVAGQSKAAMMGRLAPEWFAPRDEGKTIPVKPPYALPPTLGDTLRPFPPVTIAVRRDESLRVTAVISHRGWTGADGRSATAAFANWLEQAIVDGGNPAGELIPGGIFK